MQFATAVYEAFQHRDFPSATAAPHCPGISAGGNKATAKSGHAGRLAYTASQRWVTTIGPKEVSNMPKTTELLNYYLILRTP